MPKLTKRELDILTARITGDTYAEIARRLNTARQNVHKILIKAVRLNDLSDEIISGISKYDFQLLIEIYTLLGGSQSHCGKVLKLTKARYIRYFKYEYFTRVLKQKDKERFLRFLLEFINSRIVSVSKGLDSISIFTK